MIMIIVIIDDADYYYYYYCCNYYRHYCTEEFNDNSEKQRCFHAVTVCSANPLGCEEPLIFHISLLLLL